MAGARMSACSIVADGACMCVRFKGSQSECMREAKRLETEQGLKCWQIFCLNRLRGLWVLVV